MYRTLGTVSASGMLFAGSTVSPLPSGFGRTLGTACFTAAVSAQIAVVSLVIASCAIARLSRRASDVLYAASANPTAVALVISGAPR
jgi:hypothetical protein